MNLINAFSRKKLHKDYNIDNINMFQGTLVVFDMPNWYIEHPQGILHICHNHHNCWLCKNIQ